MSEFSKASIEYAKTSNVVAWQDMTPAPTTPRKRFVRTQVGYEAEVAEGFGHWTFEVRRSHGGLLLANGTSPSEETAKMCAQAIMMEAQSRNR